MGWDGAGGCRQEAMQVGDPACDPPPPSSPYHRYPAAGPWYVAFGGVPAWVPLVRLGELPSPSLGPLVVVQTETAGQPGLRRAAVSASCAPPAPRRGRPAALAGQPPPATPPWEPPLFGVVRGLAKCKGLG